MASSGPRQWFHEKPLRELVRSQEVVTLPGSPATKWRIKRIINQYDYQVDTEILSADRPSYASVRLLCHEERNSNNRAMMRIYYQVPFVGTECQTPKDRAKQANRSFESEELAAYQTLTKHPVGSTIIPPLLAYQVTKQDDNGLVPGGFLIYIVWSIVRGVQLGDRTGKAPMFWKSFNVAERKLIREEFLKTMNQLREIRILPQSPRARNLVWHSRSQKLYWVGFRQCKKVDGEHDMRKVWWAAFDLVKFPPKERPLAPNWNGDTTNWKW